MLNKDNWSIERAVVVLTPVFGAAATWLVAFVGTHVPGAPHLGPSTVEGVEIATFVGVCGVIAKWLHGRQIPEIAKLEPSPAEVQALEAIAVKYLAAHTDKWQGPPGAAGIAGPPGVTPDQVQSFIRDELRTLLGTNAAAAPTS